jgi:hypothetical protein
MQRLLVYCTFLASLFSIKICMDIASAFTHSSMFDFFPSQVMNDAFGFSLRDDYKEGPYYRFLIRFSAYVSAAKINLASSGTTETCAGRNSSTCPLV